MKPESELLRGIQEQTDRELERIRREVDRLERDRAAAGDREIENLQREIEERTETQIRKIEKAAKAYIATETHKIRLQARERFFEQVMGACTERMHRLIRSEEYPAILKGWIVEAALGLGAEECSVRTTREEQELCLRILPEAESEVRDLIGHEVQLQGEGSDPLEGQGVVLTARSGRIAYNNQVRTRLMRRQSEIRRVIYEELVHPADDTASRDQQRRESKHDNG